MDIEEELAQIGLEIRQQKDKLNGQLQEIINDDLSSEFLSYHAVKSFRRGLVVGFFLGFMVASVVAVLAL